jgi:hypothetical protein
VKSFFTDAFPISDKQEKAVVKKDVDYIGHNYLRDGTRLRNGSIYRSSQEIVDVLEMHTVEPPMVDEGQARIIRNGTIFRDGTYNRSGFAEATIIDDLVVGKRNHYYRNGTYLRNGSILRNGGIFIPLG